MTDALASAVEAAFGPDSEAAMTVLIGYGRQPQDREPDRVRRAILALAAGDLARLRHFAEQAHQDYRDVLYWAEYPRDPAEPQTYAELRARLGSRKIRIKPDRWTKLCLSGLLGVVDSAASTGRCYSGVT